MIKRKGLAQIPLMIGLLIMAVAVPVATKLVQESQDTRNRAASVITTTPPPSGCTEGYFRCFNNVQQKCQNGSWVFQKNCPNGCSGNYCKVVTPTNIPKPPTSTPRPPTSTPKPPTATPTPTCLENGRLTTSADKCCSKYAAYLGSSLTCTIKPIATNTPKPTATNTPKPPTATPTLQCNKNTLGKCGAAGGCKLGEICKTYDNGLSYVCRTDESCKQLPTLIPTSTPTNAPGACSNVPMPNGCSCAIGSKCSSGYCSEAGKCENPPTARCQEACPNPSNKNLLQNCTPPDSDGTPKDTLCNEAGMIRPCGGKNYCCPTAGGAWTTDMTKCPAGNCTQCPGKPEAKLKGDADCSGITNINDASIWRSEFISSLLGKTVKNNWRADFDCDGKVTLNDISIWRDNFIKSL